MIKSVIKAIHILQLFSTNEPRLSLAEISERLEIPKSTAHNLLNTLLSEGFIEKVDGDAYALGTAIIALTQSVRINVEFRDRAAPLIRALADTCRESVYLAIPENDQVLYIYAIESPHRLMARSAVGEHAPLHCTSVGKAILAAMPDKDIEDMISRVRLSQFTQNTITSWQDLETELIHCRERGYAIDNQEHEENTFCIGRAILDSHGQVVGACSISGRDPEIIRGRADALSQDLIEATQEISRLMGYVPSRPSSLVNRPAP